MISALPLRTRQKADQRPLLTAFSITIYRVDAGGGVGVALQQPRFQCRTADVASAAEGDAIVISAVNYTVRIVQDDGTGMTVLVLEAD